MCFTGQKRAAVRGLAVVWCLWVYLAECRQSPDRTKISWAWCDGPSGALNMGFGVVPAPLEAIATKARRRLVAEVEALGMWVRLPGREWVK